jgi:hypothetical protein
MVYDAIIVDTHNLFYRKQKKNFNSNEVCKLMINYIENEVLPSLIENGKLYLLFDQFTKSDMGMSKAFAIGPRNIRRELMPSYKSDRKFSPIFTATINSFIKYYTYRNENILLVYGDAYEADDFVEPLIELIKKTNSHNIALVTTDHDWTRYIESAEHKVYMINSSFDKPFTVNEFEEIYKFKPTPATVTIYKAFFGDSSDNITGAIFEKKARFNVPIKEWIRDYLKEIGETGSDIVTETNRFKNTTFTEIIKKENKTVFEKILLAMFNAEVRCSDLFSRFYTNIKVIQSQLAGKDISRCIHWAQERPELNKIIHQGIFGQKFQDRFGSLRA